MILCEYGCGQEALFQTKAGKHICSKSPNSCPINRKKNAEKLKQAHKEGRMPGWNNETNLIKRAWSKGLTKETSESVKRYAEKAAKTRTGKPGTKHSQKTKEILSLKRLESLEKNPHIKWFSLPNGLKVQGTWEYNVGLRLLELGYTLKRLRVKYDSYRHYVPDFYIEELDTYIEVKGWFSNRDKEKYRKVFSEHPNLKVILIREPNYSKFIKNSLQLSDCEYLIDSL